MIERNNSDEVVGMQYRLESVNCRHCGKTHQLAEGMGDGSLYWCGDDLLKIDENDDVNIDFGC